MIATCSLSGIHECRRTPKLYTGSVWGNVTQFSIKDGTVQGAVGLTSQTHWILPKFTRSLVPHPDYHSLRHQDKMFMEFTGFHVNSSGAELGIISVLLIFHPLAMDELTQWPHIEVKKERREHHFLWHPRGQIKFVKLLVKDWNAVEVTLFLSIWNRFIDWSRKGIHLYLTDWWKCRWLFMWNTFYRMTAW